MVWEAENWIIGTLEPIGFTDEPRPGSNFIDFFMFRSVRSSDKLSQVVLSVSMIVYDHNFHFPVVAREILSIGGVVARKLDFRSSAGFR